MNTRERLTRDLEEIIKWPAGMTELEAARRASLMAWTALDLLSEAQELLDVGEGMAPLPFAGVRRFAEYADEQVRRCEQDILEKEKRKER